VEAIQPLLNTALIKDAGDQTQILDFSIYVKSGLSDTVEFGDRARVFKGSANLDSIVREEIAGKHIKEAALEQGEGDGRRTKPRRSKHKLAEQNSVRGEIAVLGKYDANSKNAF